MKMCKGPRCTEPIEPHRDFCSRSCAMAYTRSQQTPQQRRELGMKARAAQEGDRLVRLIARCKLQPTEELRILAGYRYGLSASKQRRFRARQMAGVPVKDMA